MSKKNILISILCIFFIFSCDKNRVFDKNEAVEKTGWYYEENKAFEVNIQDTASAYNLFINVRHTDAYAFKNLLLKLTTQFPDSSKQEKDIDIELAQSNGNWTGNCVDNICYNSVLIQTNVKLSQTGIYIFTIAQNMRLNPLPQLLDIGIKLEKI